MLFVAIIIAVTLIDQAVKAAVRSYMQVGDSIPVFQGLLHITYVKNPGGAFGLFQNHQAVFFVAGIIVMIFMLYLYRSVGRGQPLMTIALGLVLGGALGNLIDRISTGQVTDFIDIRIWPVFNVADSAIVVGVILLGIILLRSPDGFPDHSPIKVEKLRSSNFKGMS